MSRSIFFLFLLCSVLTHGLATIRRVNNTGIVTASPPNAALIYITAQAAHDAAIAGDTIHIEPSGTSYGDLVINKRVYVFGNGYFLGTLASNANPNLKANPAPSKITNLYIAGAAAAMTEVSGMTIEDRMYIGSAPVVGSIGVNNVIISRNRVVGTVFFHGPCTNPIFIQNYVNQIDALTGTIANFLVSNNIIISTVRFSSDDNGTFQNNISNTFLPGVNQTGLQVENSIFRNNICNNFWSTILTNSTVENNITSTTFFGTANGNQSGVIMTTIFEDFPNNSPNWSDDSRFTLKSGSPASGMGYNGSDIGPILNPNNANNNMLMNYRLSGISPIPSIYKFDAPSVVSGGTMNITISTRSNN